MSNIDKQAQQIKQAALRAKAATADYVADRMSISVCLSECEEFNRLTDGPDQILPLVEALETKEEQRANWFQMAQKLGEDLDSAEKRIAELEAKLQTADKLQDSAFRHGLQHGFSYGQTNDQAGFEQCLAAYSKKMG